MHAMSNRPLLTFRRSTNQQRSRPAISIGPQPNCRLSSTAPSSTIVPRSMDGRKPPCSTSSDTVVSYPVESAHQRAVRTPRSRPGAGRQAVRHGHAASTPLSHGSIACPLSAPAQSDPLSGLLASVGPPIDPLCCPVPVPQLSLVFRSRYRQCDRHERKPSVSKVNSTRLLYAANS